MLGLYVTVPIACFRKGLAREYLETESVPPPATCYGFLLSLVGETSRRRHIGARITCTMLSAPSERSVVLRTMWRVKSKPLGSPGNMRPDYQQLLTNLELVIWLDSASESTAPPMLEDRVRSALDHVQRGRIERFGGRCFGESTHLVDEVRLYDPPDNMAAPTFVLDDHGRETLPVWVDHVGSRDTRFVTGNLEQLILRDLYPGRIPQIVPPDWQG